jgi:SAM-dependent methyltransferase
VGEPGVPHDRWIVRAVALKNGVPSLQAFSSYPSDVSDSTLTDLVTRLERDRIEADRRYNDALTALDRALPAAVDLPAAPALDDGRKRFAIDRDFAMPPAPPADSGFLARRLHGAVWRLVGPALERQQRLNAAVVEQVNRGLSADRDARAAAGALIDATRRHLESLAAFHSRLIQFLQQITPYVDTKHRAMGGSDLRDQIVLANERTLSLKREIERMASQPATARPPLGTATASGPASPVGSVVPAAADQEAFKYLGFEDRFRGSRDEIRRRLIDYVPVFSGASDVLDVGCGRGELLELLREAGIGARGIDSNERMVSVCAERGLHAEQADALGYLRAQPDRSLGGLIAVQVVEHFQPDYLMAFLEAAFHALRPGATLVLETINPACWMAFFETYLRDLTHARPLHPDTLRFLVEASGFTQAQVSFRVPVREEDRLPRVEAAPTDEPSVQALAAALNAHADQLNARLFSSMDYALIARR